MVMYVLTLVMLEITVQWQSILVATRESTADPHISAYLLGLHYLQRLPSVFLHEMGIYCGLYCGKDFQLSCTSSSVLRYS